ncbi:MAG: LamG-like jellyroll fold domain-containing protein, partial [Opitutales bacterium]
MIRFLFCSVFLIVGVSSLFSQELRIWHDQNGQEIHAIRKKVEGDNVLMLKEGKEFLFQISILSDEDQAYVREWAARSSRTARGLLALYDFGLAEGATVKDVSGVEPALDLQIVNLRAVKRAKGSLEISGKTMIRSIKVPTKIIKTVKGSGALTVEVWVRPANLKQEGPARIVTISKDTSNRNFTLGQEGHRYDVRLRTSKTSRNGMPSLPAPAKSVTTKLSHLTYSRERGGKARFFVNGKQVAEKNLAGDLKNWDGSYRLCLGNEFSNDRAWQGSYHLLAIYGRALSPQEVKKNFEAGAGGVTADLVAARKREEGGHLFETQVAPLLAKHCLECHDTAIRKGKLDLTRRASAFAGGSEGPPIVPRKPDASLLWEMVASNDMPKKREALTAAEKKVLRDWIQAGAPWTLDYVDAATYVHDSHGPGNWVRRLTIPEYVATVKTVTGVNVRAEAHQLLPPDLRADGFSNTAYNLKVDFKHVEAFAKLAEIVVKRMNVQAFAKRFHNKLTLDKETRVLMEKMGKWVLRGPLEEREVLLYRGITTTMASAGASFEQAVGSAIEAMLQSPRFIYRIEDQRESDSVEGYEMAVRMSYLLWGAPPD